MGEPEEIIVGADYAEAAVGPGQNEPIEKIEPVAWWIVFSRYSRGAGGGQRGKSKSKNQTGK
jgi:hypothetical protein